jgi:hypothetical protein
VLRHSDGCDKFGVQRSREPYQTDHAHCIVSVKRKKKKSQASLFSALILLLYGASTAAMQ